MFRTVVAARSRVRLSWSLGGRMFGGSDFSSGRVTRAARTFVVVDRRLPSRFIHFPFLRWPIHRLPSSPPPPTLARFVLSWTEEEAVEEEYIMIKRNGGRGNEKKTTTTEGNEAERGAVDSEARRHAVGSLAEELVAQPVLALGTPQFVGVGTVRFLFLFVLFVCLFFSTISRIILSPGTQSSLVRTG